jgi:hypothetical protein
MYTLLIIVLALAGSSVVHWAERRGRDPEAPDVPVRRASVYLVDLYAVGMILRSVDTRHAIIAGETAGMLSIAGFFLLSMTCFMTPIAVWVRRSFSNVGTRRAGSGIQGLTGPDRPM